MVNFSFLSYTVLAGACTGSITQDWRVWKKSGERNRRRERKKMERNANSREEKREIVSTQIRLPTGMHEYIKREAERMGIAQNTFLIILLEQGRKLWEADITHLREVK